MSSQTVENTGPATLAAAPDYCRCDTLVLGCGNELFGDDGFGPAVARRLADSQEAPRSVVALDVGTSVRHVLFNIVLSPLRPRRIIVVDAVDQGRRPGEVWTMKARDLPEVKCDDFSMHQLPTSNLLRELDELGGVEVTCVVAQVSPLPGEVRPGLSTPLRGAVPLAVEMILESCRPAARPGDPVGAARVEEQSHA
jgi:coenzyme F420 hydrogenase subunit delta